MSDAAGVDDIAGKALVADIRVRGDDSDLAEIIVKSTLFFAGKGIAVRNVSCTHITDASAADIKGHGPAWLIRLTLGMPAA